MKALVVYESMFGNTQRVAEAIAAGLATHSHVDVIEVGVAPMRLPEDLDVLVVGAPTHAFGLSRPSTRQDAAGRTAEPLVSPRLGAREWLDGLSPLQHIVAAAGFDTKLGKPSWLPGSAARAIAKRLRNLRFGRAAMPASFYVESVTGPLSPGELTRARAWGDSLAKTWLALGNPAPTRD